MLGMFHVMPFMMISMSWLKSAACLASSCALKARLCIANVAKSSSGGSEDNCSGFVVSTSNESGGHLPVATPKGEEPLMVNRVCLAQMVSSQLV